MSFQGFRKVDPDKWEFANEGFLKGQRHLMKHIIRRKTQYCSSSQTSNKSLASCVEVEGTSGSDAEIDRLRGNKQVLMMELVKLRKQQEKTLSCLKTMEQRLKWAEMKQRETTSFLIEAIQNPTLLQQMLGPKLERKHLEVVNNKRRRRMINHTSESSRDEELVFHEAENTNSSTIGGNGFPELGQGSMENAYDYDVDIGQFRDGNFYVKLEPQESGDIPRFGDSELEKLALSMQNPQLIVEGKSFEKGDYRPIDAGFWEGIINAGIDEIDTLDVEEGGLHDLVEQLGYLGSNQM